MTVPGGLDTSISWKSIIKVNELSFSSPIQTVKKVLERVNTNILEVGIIESKFLVLKKCFDLETAREAAQLAPERPVEVDHLLPHQVGDVHVKTPDESQNMDILYESK